MATIGDYIKQQREQAKSSLRQLAEQAGVSNPYLSQIERGLRKPSADILQQIAKGLRISAEALYVQAGILEDRPAHPQLSERQKQVLVEIYESFRRENATDAGTGADAEADGPPELTVGSPGAEAEGLATAPAAEAGAAAEAAAEEKAGAKAGAQPPGDAQTVPRNRPDSASD